MLCRPLAATASLLLIALPSLVHAQAHTGGTEVRDSRVDLYGGYSFLKPVQNSGIGGYPYKEINNPAATGSLGIFFNRYLGVQFEGGYFSGRDQHRAYFPNCTQSECDQLVYSGEGGVIARYPLGRFVPFVHALGGGERYNGPVANPLKWGWGVTGGIGFDYVLPGLGQHLAVRPIQADYQFSQVVYGPLVLPAAVVGGFGQLGAIKLSGGLVLRLGDTNHAPSQLALGCTVSPAAVFAGDPVRVSSSTIGFDMRHRADYVWTSNGGSIRPEGSEATIDTTGLQPGQYTVIGRLSQGARAHHQAECDAAFTIRSLEPPAVTCSANPPATAAGSPVTISAVGSSPENRPLTYSYGASVGTINGTGTLATLSTDGVAPGTIIQVSCNAVDDFGQHATATTTVTLTGMIPVAPAAVEVPEAAEPATLPPLCTLSFERDRRRPTRVDNEAKACLDDIALAMGRQVEARLVMVGSGDPGESTRIAEERAANARHYLVAERGIDPARIVVEVGQRSGRTVTNTLVPAGSTFDDPAASTFAPAPATSAAPRTTTHRRAHRTGSVFGSFTGSGDAPGTMSGTSHPPASSSSLP